MIPRDQAVPDPLNPPAIDVCAVGVLRHLRLDADLSIRQLAELTGINKGRLSVLERGALAAPWELHAILDAIYDVRGLASGKALAAWTHRHDEAPR